MLITPFVFDNSKNVLQSYYIFCKYTRKASIILKNAFAMFRYFSGGSQHEERPHAQNYWYGIRLSTPKSKQKIVMYALGLLND